MERGDIYLGNLLKEYKSRYAKERKELSKLPEGTLTFRHVNGKVQFVQLVNTVDGGVEAPKRKGITRNTQLTMKLARKKYLEISTALLSSEINRLSKYIDQRTEPSPDNIINMLSENWNHVPRNYLFPYKANQEIWAGSEYRRNSKNPNELRHTTSKGLKVRSKSELLIAEKLDSYNIPYRYEQVIGNNRYIFSPDFTIKTKNKIIYWEHCGMMADPDYRAYNKWKLSQYEMMNIVPWDNLIVTYDQNDGDFDMRIIDAEIINKLIE